MAAVYLQYGVLSSIPPLIPGNRIQTIFQSDAGGTHITRVINKFFLVYPFPFFSIMQIELNINTTYI